MERFTVNVLSLNLGSSSLKYSIHDVSSGNGRALFQKSVETSSQPKAAGEAAAAAIADTRKHAGRIDAIGHRIVFGGPDDSPKRVTAELVTRLQSLQNLDPLHAPGALAVMRQVQTALPEVPNVACFDTFFFHDLPQVARALPLPEAGSLLRRFGFHGLSYESIVRTLGNTLGHRTVLAHLGNGSSAAALLDGKPVESTMGFSPLGGMIMATRPGDVDPGAILYLLERTKMAPAALRDLLENRSGLYALSAGEPDIQKLCEQGDPRSRFAVEMFARSVAKAVGALATCLGGIDMLVFTGGIGEHNSAVRDEIAARTMFLNSNLDVRTAKSDENLAIALYTAAAA